jgi:hypothetical protein
VGPVPPGPLQAKVGPGGGGMSSVGVSNVCFLGGGGLKKRQGAGVMSMYERTAYNAQAPPPAADTLSQRALTDTATLNMHAGHAISSAASALGQHLPPPLPRDARCAPLPS